MSPRVRECREEGCTEPALDQVAYCATHIGASRRCKATKPGSEGKIRCKKAAMVGLDVCRRHGGGTPNAKKASNKAQVLTTMQRFVRPYQGDLNPVSAFEMEFRRTLGRIAWYDEQLANLRFDDDAQDLIWGMTKHETATGADGIPNTTYEARINILEEMQRWERKHLLDMEKVWISAGLESARLDLMRTYVDQTYDLTMRALRALGIDVKDPKVRDIMAEIFLGDAPPAPLALEGPR